MRRALAGMKRFIVTPETSEHRVFIFVPGSVRPRGSLFAIARDDELCLGLLSSRIHEVWATAQGNRLGVGNQRRYNVGVSFETFPFPEGLTPNVPPGACTADPRAQGIAGVAKRLHELREAWLNPQNLVLRMPEVVPGYPDRLLPRDEACAKELKKRTLTNLYNQRPAWLDILHRKLDGAVAAAYGWPADLPDEEVLKRLLELNRERAAAGR